MPNPVKNFIWSGGQLFYIHGSGHHEDTLLIETEGATEQLCRLILPTLCITYADLSFANAIGGVQENYPTSARYGELFDPPVVLDEESIVTKFTWIRGAHRIVIGSETTEIDWYSWKPLVVPRLRVDRQKPAVAEFSAKNVSISVDKGFIVQASQYADGRQTGGIRIEKYHPDWKPKETPRVYQLTLRLVDSETMEPMVEAMLNHFRWVPKTPTSTESGHWRQVNQYDTDSEGIIHQDNLLSDELEAIALGLPGWGTIARCYRPLPGQLVNIFMEAWRLNESFIPYSWKVSDNILEISKLTGFTPEKIFHFNKFTSKTELLPNKIINLPCYEATYHLESGDTLEWLAKLFSYNDVEELKVFNLQVTSSKKNPANEIRLPGWYFLYARHGDALDQIDNMFNLPPGWSRTVSKVYHPNPRLLVKSEIIAVPSMDFIRTHQI